MHQETVGIQPPPIGRGLVNYWSAMLCIPKKSQAAFGQFQWINLTSNQLMDVACTIEYTNTAAGTGRALLRSAAVNLNNPIEEDNLAKR